MNGRPRNGHDWLAESIAGCHSWNKNHSRVLRREIIRYLRKCLAEYVVEQRPKHLDRDFKSALSRDVEYGPLPLTAGLTLISSQLDLIESEPSGDDDDSGKTTQGQAVPFDPRNIWSPQPEAEPDGGALSDEGAKSFGMFFIVLTIGFRWPLSYCDSRSACTRSSGFEPLETKVAHCQ